MQTNPLLAVASELLGLAGSRVTASEVLNLVQSEPVRARFGFTDDDLDDITSWVREANMATAAGGTATPPRSTSIQARSRFRPTTVCVGMYHGFRFAAADSVCRGEKGRRRLMSSAADSPVGSGSSSTSAGYTAPDGGNRLAVVVKQHGSA